MKTDEFKRFALEYLQTAKSKFEKLYPNDKVTIENSKEWKDANELFQTFEADGKDYKLVTAYLKEQYKSHCDRDKILDEKADTIIKLLGSGTALISFGTLLSLKLDTANSIAIALVILIALIPAIVFSAVSLYRAIRTKEPREAAELPPATLAINCVKQYDVAVAETYIWMILHPMCVQYAHRNKHKSDELEKAYWNYRMAVFALAIPFIAVIIALIVMFSNCPSKPF